MYLQFIINVAWIQCQVFGEGLCVRVDVMYTGHQVLHGVTLVAIMNRLKLGCDGKLPPLGRTATQSLVIIA